MSLVGTRPILQDELQKYELHHRARIAIKPGITGMWQVSGRSDITDFEEVVRLDTEGNELESLKYVLNEYVSVDDLKARINIIDSNALNYYQNNKVAFCNAPVIGWSDSQGVFTQLAKRIYFTRNSLVHSKSGKNKERYGCVILREQTIKQN